MHRQSSPTDFKSSRSETCHIVRFSSNKMAMDSRRWISHISLRAVEISNEMYRSICHRIALQLTDSFTFYISTFWGLREINCAFIWRSCDFPRRGVVWCHYDGTKARCTYVCVRVGGRYNCYSSKGFQRDRAIKPLFKNFRILVTKSVRETIKFDSIS